MTVSTITYEWIKFRAVLAWHYGPDRAFKILYGLDDAANDDIDAWRRLRTK